MEAINTAETNAHDFSLINGTFDFDDTREILMTAYHAKINFHKLKAWSKSERGEAGGDLHTARALELEIESENIKKHLKANSQNGMKIKMTCVVRLEFEPENENHIFQTESVHSHEA